MPAKSAAQQKAAGAALSAKRGNTPVSKLKGASKGMYKSMSKKELDKMASTKRKGKPERASKSSASKSKSKKSLLKSHHDAVHGAGRVGHRQANEAGSVRVEEQGLRGGRRAVRQAVDQHVEGRGAA
jgi:hypothetical protein